MKRLKLADGTTWPDLLSKEIDAYAWALHHNSGALSQNGCHAIAEIISAFRTLMDMTIREREGVIRMIKEARTK